MAALSGKGLGALLLASCLLAVVVARADAATVRLATAGDGKGVVRIELANGPSSMARYWGDCPPYCGETIDDALIEGLSLVLVFTAQPAAGSSFVGWSGSCRGTAPVCRVPLQGRVEATATFVRKAALSSEAPSSRAAPSFAVGGEAILSSPKSGRPDRPHPVTIDLVLRTIGDPFGPVAFRICCTPRGGGLNLILPRTLLRAGTDEAQPTGALCNLALSRDPRRPCPISTRIATGEMTTVRILTSPRGLRERWLVDWYALGPPEEAVRYVGRRYLVVLRRPNGKVVAYSGRANVETTTADLEAPLPEEVRSKILIVGARIRLGGTSAGRSWVASTGCPSSGLHTIRWGAIRGAGSPGTPLQARCTP